MTERPPTASRSAAQGKSTLARLIDPILLILVGCCAIGDGGRIIVTKSNVVGGSAAGGWIAGLGALLVIGSLVYIVQATRRPAEQQSGAPELLFRPPAIAFAMLVVYVALIEPLGYTLATALFMAAYLRSFGRYNIFVVAAITLAFAAGSGWLWAAMNMMMPQGLLPWP